MSLGNVRSIVIGALLVIVLPQSRAELRCQDLFGAAAGSTNPRPAVGLDQAIQEIVQLKFEMEGADPSTTLRTRLERMYHEVVSLYRGAYPSDFQTAFEKALRQGRIDKSTESIARRDELIRREQNAAIYGFTREAVHDLDRKVIGVVGKDLLLVEGQTHLALYDLKSHTEIAKLNLGSEKGRHLTLSQDLRQILFFAQDRLGIVDLHLQAKSKFSKIRWIRLPGDFVSATVSDLGALGQGRPIVMALGDELKIFEIQNRNMNLVGQLTAQEKITKVGVKLIDPQWLVVEGGKGNSFLFDLISKQWIEVPALASDLCGRLLHATPGREPSEILLHFETGLVISYDLATKVVNYPLGAERFMFDGGMITAGSGRHLVLYGKPGPFWSQPVRIYDRTLNVWLESPFANQFVRPRHFRRDGSGRHLIFSDIHFRDAGDPQEAFLYRLDLQTLTGETFNLDPSRYPVSEVVNFDGSSILFYFGRQWIEIF